MTYGGFLDTKKIVDTVFGLKTRGDFQKFPKFSKNLEKFAMVLDFFREFSAVFGAAEKWKNNSGIRLLRRGQFNETRKFFYARF